MTLWQRPADTPPLVIAHRGASSAAPENTLAAFDAAREAGADGIELDVRLCATGEPVVIHDARVDRTTNGCGAVSVLGLAELRRLDAGSWFSERFAGEPVPTLDEALEVAAGHLLVNVEIKGADATAEAAPLVTAIASVVRSHGMADWVLVSSFDPLALVQMRRAAPELPLALLYSQIPSSDLRRRLPDLCAVHPRHDLVNGSAVEAAHRCGRLINTWTVNERTDMLRLTDLGVDGIITDDPALLRQTLV